MTNRIDRIAKTTAGEQEVARDAGANSDAETASGAREHDGAPARDAKTSPVSRFAERDLIRLRLAEPYLRGRGAEVGAGGYPALLPDGVECHYFDKRTREEMVRFLGDTTLPSDRLHAMSEAAEVFPAGADFLLAHNVLEHVPNPIAALIEWQAMVRSGGTVVLSVPQAGYGPDKQRLTVSFEHVLLDYLLDRNGGEGDFETREHVFAALSGFDKGKFKGAPKVEQAQTAFSMAKSPDLVVRDVFWHVHVFMPDTFLQTVHAAASFARKRVELLDISSAEHEDPARRNEGEIILVYKLHAADGAPAELIARALLATAQALERLMTRFTTGLPTPQAP